MISEIQREKLKPILGNRFSKEVQKILQESDKTVYSKGFISNVLNGNYENTDVECALVELYQKRHKEKKRLQKKLSTL